MSVWDITTAVVILIPATVLVQCIVRELEGTVIKNVTVDAVVVYTLAGSCCSAQSGS